jgi:ATP-binding cassette subfamily B protein
MSDRQSGKQKRKATIGSAFREEELGQMSDRALIARLWHFMRPYGVTFFFCLLLLPLISGTQLVQPWLLQVAIDDYIVPGSMDGFWVVLLAFAGAVFGRGLIQFLQFYLMQLAGQKALRDLRQAAFDHVQSRAISFFHRNPVGRLMTRMTTDIESLQNALTSGMVTMLGDIVTLIGTIGILLYMDWRLALVSLSVAPFLILVTVVFRYLLRKAFREIRTNIARLYAHLQESITGMDVIQLFVRENVSAEEYEGINREYRNAYVRAIRWDAMLYAIVEAVGAITIGLIIWYGSGQVLREALTLGVLVAFIEYMNKFFVPIRDLAQKYNLLQSAMASSERIFGLLDDDEQLPDTGTLPPPDGDFSIRFENVWFAYNDEEWVLRDVSFEVRPGEKIAFVGHTGAGKSTIIRLVMRLYDVTRGAIYVNGRDIREYDLQAYRRRFAVVLQDVFLFQGSIRDNITLGTEVDDETFEDAVHAVHADTIASRYETGFAQEVEERGGNLSAGERQLVSFARALVHRPEVLVLDEATANVDTETESLIQDAVEVMMKRQTSLVIAHRLSTICNSDRIIVLDHGEIIEVGSHEDLLEQGGHYRTLYRLQYAEDYADIVA